jgi:hypothetical protein
MMEKEFLAGDEQPLADRPRMVSRKARSRTEHIVKEEAMELARVEFPIPPGTVTAILTSGGWSIPDSPESPRGQGLERILNLIFPMSQYGSSDGDPVACAARSAAESLEGTVTFIRPQPEGSPTPIH